MKALQRTLGLLGLALITGLLPVTAFAQEAPQVDPQPEVAPRIQNMRPYDQHGVTMFEAPKQEAAPFEGLKVDWGAAFTQQFQGLQHSNTAGEVLGADGSNVNELYQLGNGFNLATANLTLDAQLAQGIRVNLTTYLSARHHPEAWVKGGYLQVDDLSILGVPALNTIMDYVTVKAGHFEINYGDAHFRRTDNGNAMYNPFVGNYIMDAFTTEIGGEVYAQHNGFLGMVGLSGGEIKGDVKAGGNRAPSIYGKLGVDRQLNEDLRVRLTGSAYTTSSSASNTLYGGDRAGSRYYLVLENAKANAANQFTSGLINPGMRDAVTSVMVNPFVKFNGLELFGVIERAEGRAHNETENRVWNQYAVDAIFRFLPREQAYVGARYNTVSGELAGSLASVSADRYQIGAGWFLTPNVLVKAEYVNQQYNDYAHESILCNGKFNGFMVEGVIAF